MPPSTTYDKYAGLDTSHGRRRFTSHSDADTFEIELRGGGRMLPQRGYAAQRSSFCGIPSTVLSPLFCGHRDTSYGGLNL